MLFVDDLFSPGTMVRLGWMLVHVLWQATAVAVLLAVFLRLLRRTGANVRYAMACAALALMVVLPIVTLRFIQVPGPVAEAGPSPVTAVVPSPDQGATPKRSLSVLDSGLGYTPEDTLRTSLGVPPVAPSMDLTPTIPLRERIVTALEPALPYVVLGWLVGVFGLSAWHLGGWTQLQRLRHRMVREIGVPLHRRLEELALRLGVPRAVGLLESALVEVPTVVGWLRPVILLPASALTGLRPEQLEAILAHELAHIRRYDYLVNILQTVVEILGFYHPAVWWVSHRIRIERENCCDDLAVQVCGSSLQYARALACMEEIRHSAGNLAVAATGGSLMARIARLLGHPVVEDRRFAWLPGLIALLLVVGLILPAALVLGTPRTPQTVEPVATGISSADQSITKPNAAEILLDFRMVKVGDDLRVDRETVLRMANALGAESLLARELLGPGRTLGLTLGEILKRYVVPQSLSAEATEAVIDLLQLRGYLSVSSRPRLLVLDGKPAQAQVFNQRLLPAADPSGKIARIKYGTIVNVTPHVLDSNRVALKLMAEISDLVPGPDANQPTVARTTAETNVTAANDRYLIWAAIEPTATTTEPGANRQSIYIMVKPHINLPLQGLANADANEKPAGAHRRQVLLHVRTVTMERSDLLNLGVEWSWPKIQAGVFSDPSAGTPSPAADAKWPYGVQIGYTPDGQFTDSLLNALDLLQENGQAYVSGQQILAQEGHQSQIKALTEEWSTVTAAATKQPPQARKTETGTVVTITPYVGDNNDITLQTAVEVSTSVPKAGGSDPPLVTRRTARNAVTIRDGGTVALAGLTANRTGPNDKSTQEIAIFVTAHLIDDSEETTPPALPSAEPTTQAPRDQADKSSAEATVTATFANTDLLAALAEISQRTGVKIAPDATVKAALVTAKLDGASVDAALRQILQRTPYHFRKTAADTYIVYRPISMELEGVELAVALADIAAMAEVPIISDLHITGLVYAKLDDLTFEDALEIVLAGRPYGFKRTPRAYLVADRGRLSSAATDTEGTDRVRSGATTSPEQHMMLRRQYVNSDPIVREVAKRIVNTECELIVLLQTLAADHPTVVQKNAFLKALREALDGKRVELEQQFDAGLAERLRTSGGTPADMTTGMVTLEHVASLRREYVNSDPMVQELSKNIVETERELIVLHLTLARDHPTVIQKTELLKTLRGKLHQRCTESREEFDRGLAERLRTAASRSGSEATVTATFTDTDLLQVLAEMSQRTGVRITADATVKTTPVTAELVEVPLETALQQVLKNTPYILRKAKDGTYLVFRPLSFTFPQVELIPALQDLSAATGVTIIPDPHVTGRVAASFKDVSLDEALEFLLAGKPYVFHKTPHYYVVTERGVIGLPRTVESFETRRIRLKYVQPTRVKQLLSPVFAPYVRMEPPNPRDPNDQGNVLLVTAAPAIVDQIVADLKQIDCLKRQVLLDARVVVMERGDLLNLSVEWNWPKIQTGAFTDRALDPNTGTASNSWPWGVRIGYTRDRTFTDSLLMALNQLKEDGRADIIANPKMVALDGRQAEMRAIQEEWFMAPSPDPNFLKNYTQLTKIESGTVLTITPYLGDDNDVTLQVAVEVSDRLPKSKAPDGYIITRRTVKNSVTIKDGGTVVVGGLTENRNRSSGKGVPGLSDWPLIGKLFQNNGNDKANREIAVFVTVHLIPEPAAVPSRTPASDPPATQVQPTMIGSVPTSALPVELRSVGSPEDTLKARQIYLNPDADPFLRELRRRTVEYAKASKSPTR